MYDPAPAFWSASAPDVAGDPVLSQNTVTIDVETGSSTVAPEVTMPPNRPPDCSRAAPSVAELWPPEHALVTVPIIGVFDPDIDPVTLTITGVAQDEPVNAKADGNTCPDASGVGTSTAILRAERSAKGNGRVYHVTFSAADGKGGTCTGTVKVCVPHDQRPGHTCGDEGSLVDSTKCS